MDPINLKFYPQDEYVIYFLEHRNQQKSFPYLDSLVAFLAKMASDSGRLKVPQNDYYIFNRKKEAFVLDDDGINLLGSEIGDYDFRFTFL